MGKEKFSFSFVLSSFSFISRMSPFCHRKKEGVPDACPSVTSPYMLTEMEKGFQLPNEYSPYIEYSLTLRQNAEVSNGWLW
jgi:hypothetical protein